MEPSSEKFKPVGWKITELRKVITVLVYDHLGIFLCLGVDLNILCILYFIVKGHNIHYLF